MFSRLSVTRYRRIIGQIIESVLLFTSSYGCENILYFPYYVHFEAPLQILSNRRKSYLSFYMFFASDFSYLLRTSWLNDLSFNQDFSFQIFVKIL